MRPPARFAPSVLNADLLRLQEQVAAVEAAGADWIHVDVMDGQFVPSITFGASLVSALGRITRLPLDAHLMVVEPERQLQAFADAGASVFTFHPEATRHVQRLLVRIRECGMHAGLALNPATPLAWAEEVLDDIDLLLIMTVNPGYGGQEYIEASTDKIRRARQLLDQRGSRARLQVDGGIARSTIARAYDAGADTFVAGSAIFKAPDPAAALRELRNICFETV